MNYRKSIENQINKLEELQNNVVTTKSSVSEKIEIAKAIAHLSLIAIKLPLMKDAPEPK